MSNHNNPSAHNAPDFADVGAAILQVQGLLQKNALKEAKALCTRLCDAHPTSYSAWSLLGAINGQLADYPEAERSCRQAIKLQPSEFSAHANLGATLMLQGKSREAGESLKRALEINPNDAQTHNNLGNLYRNTNEPVKAKASYETAIELHPAYAEAYNNLGSVLHTMGELEEARACYEKALGIAPNYPLVQYNLGMVLLQLGSYDKAIDISRKVLVTYPEHVGAHLTVARAINRKGDTQAALDMLREIAPRHPQSGELHHQIGKFLERLGRFEEALQTFNQIAAKHPASAQLLYDIAGVCYSLGRTEQALTHLWRALELNPEFTEAMVLIGQAHLLKGRTHGANQLFEKTLKIDPGSAAALSGLGHAAKIDGDLDKALRYFERSVAANSSLDDAINGKAATLEQLGRREEAYETLKPLLECAPDMVDSYTATVFSLLSPHLGLQEKAVEINEAILNRPGLSVKASADLCFNLGKLYDDKKHYDKAFGYYKKANDYYAPEFDISTHERTIDSIASIFNEEWVKEMPRSTKTSERPILIVGMPRSGTSLIEQILASHPQVFGAGELPELTTIANKVIGNSGDLQIIRDNILSLSTDDLDQKADSYLSGLPAGAGDAARVTDKMPYNYLHLGLIEMLLPGCRIIHSQRDPLDNCISCYFHHFSGGHEHIYRLADIGAYYRNCDRLMRHWKNVLSLPILEVQYEHLVEDQEAVSRQIVEFCGLEWDPQCLNFHENKRVVSTASYDQVRRPMYKSAMARWKRYEKHLAPLMEALGL